MTNFTPRGAIAALTLVMALPAVAFADSHSSLGSGDLAAMAGQLGLDEAVVQGCMPAPTEEKPAQHPDLVEITDCMNDGGGSLTTAQVNQAWLDHRP